MHRFICIPLLVSAGLLAQDARALFEAGRRAFVNTEYKKASDAFEKAVAAEPRNSDYSLWLGRAYGRRAEMASVFTAPGLASKARRCFEKAVELDPRNAEALNDLFDYYVEAPGLLGGGFDKAEALIGKIAAIDPAEGHYAQAQLLDRRQRFDEAEQQLRWALELAPRQVGRVLDLAAYLSKRGRVEESEKQFEKAQKMAPNDPKVLYTRAETYVRDHRNLDKAKQLLQQYLASNLSPDDPPRAKAQELLRKANGA